ncbi:MAG: hypothetical protein AABP62_00620 [Planctomycetota bacterium]
MAAPKQIVRLFVLATMTCLLSCGESAAGELADGLKTLDVLVATAEERDGLANQVRDDVRTRLQQANSRSSAEWQAVRSREDWERLRSEKLNALRASLGSWPLPPASVRVHVTGTVEGDGFRVDNVLFETRPGWWVTANLYRPSQARESMPGILICHAHHTPKEHGELQDMGMTWARAGCLVLVPDQLGHGERRQHPFASVADFAKPFRVGHADYSFRYDSAVQLHLIGESLIGWMAWDMMRGIDVLLAQPGIDVKRLILLGAVAGGGDPAAVVGALDDRLAAVVPFNFGGPQPETRFPLPDDAERTFHYAGGGSWESTRNLRCSAGEGFLPWMIVGSVAPRRLVYAHEFNWDQERDPVWRRLQTIYGFYEQPASLAWTNGRGAVTGSSPQDTHCTHIGRVHRARIHESFRQWFGIDVTHETEFSSRVPADRLRCWTPEMKQLLQPKSLSTMTTELADSRIAQARQSWSVMSPTERRRDMRSRWEKLLGGTTLERLTNAEQRSSTEDNGVRVERWMLTLESGIRLPCVLLVPQKKDSRHPVVLAVCSQGKARLLKERSAEISQLLERGAVVCLLDPRGLGESKLGDSHGRRSSATSITSSELMLGGTMLGQQLRDVRLTCDWLRRHPAVQSRPIALWGESLLPPNDPAAPFRTPRDDDGALPPPSEPNAPLLALLTGLVEDDVAAIYAVGGPVSWRSLLADYLVLLAHDAVVPGALTAGEIADLASAQRSTTRVRLEGLVDGWNRLASDRELQSVREIAKLVSLEPGRSSPVTWLLPTR